MGKEKIYFAVPVLAVLFLAGNLSFAQEEPKGEPLPPGKSYTYNLRELIKKANENIKKVDKELERQAIDKRNEKKESLAREHFEKGDALYKEGKLQEAQREWRKVLEIAKSPDFREYIRSSEKKAQERELLDKKQERERQARVKQEQARIDRENKEKLRQAKLEAEKQEKARKEKLAAEPLVKKEAEKQKTQGQTNYKW